MSYSIFFCKFVLINVCKFFFKVSCQFYDPGKSFPRKKKKRDPFEMYTNIKGEGVPVFVEEEEHNWSWHWLQLAEPLLFTIIRAVYFSLYISYLF
jgi:hypothetical protein